MKSLRPFAASLALLLAAPAAAQSAPPPKLIVMVSVDQFSADLFAEYRAQFREGFARLMSGAVFSAGYQSHAATETCPGHSTILTGAHPSRTGIIANDWIDFRVARKDKTIYCAEDADATPPTPGGYVVSDRNLKASTLGEWMKAADPASRVVSVAGKDRAAVMMGGHKTDQIWWFDGKKFASYAGRAVPTAVAEANARVAARIAEARGPVELPAYCRDKWRAVPIGGGKSVGDGRFAREAGDVRLFRASSEFDEAVVGLAGALAAEMKLGEGPQTDLLIVGASGTDYVGHTLGTQGSEMCLQLLALDHFLGQLFASLDARGIDYAVALTADHGGLDMPERSGEAGSVGGARVDPALIAGNMGKEIAAQFRLEAPVLHGGSFGDIYVDPKLKGGKRKKVLAEAMRRYRGHPQVQTVFTRAEIEATAQPHTPPETWSLIERARDSYDPERSGDFIVALKPRITPIVDPTKGYVATHGSFWDYDRRVPMLFWRKGMTGFEQPLSVETVDIAPTLAAIAHVPVPVTIDGKCLDLDVGPGDSCK